MNAPRTEFRHHARTCALASAFLLAPFTTAFAQERCTDTAELRTCTGATGPVRTRTVAERPGGDFTEAEVVVPVKYADSPGYARAVGSVTLQLVPFSTVLERTDLFARLTKTRAPSPAWVRSAATRRAVEGDGVVRVEAKRMERK